MSLRRVAASVLACAIGLVIAGASVASTPGHVVISQIYGGGGNSGAPLSHDYVELFNPTGEPISLDGLSIQYASATGTGNFGANAGQRTELSGTIQPGRYFLVQQAAGTTGDGDPLPTPDLVDPTPINMAAGSGKVALVSGTDTLGCNGGPGQPCSPEQLDRIVDLVGYGGANFFEGSGAAPTLSNTLAAFRAEGGCVDTDDNAADFASGSPAPRNSAAPGNDCDPAAVLVVSQLYGGGGNAGSTYTHDFVEIFNRGQGAVDLGGWSVQYASAAGSTWQVTQLSGTVQPGQYYLVQLAQGAGGTTPLPTPDATGTTNMSATNGKVALVAGTASLSGTCPLGGNVVDFVGFGANANCFEGSGPTPTLSNTTAALRAAAGCVDTDDNAADFTREGPAPRNSASPLNVCPTDPPPFVASTTPANGASEVALDATITVEFSEPVTVSAGWYEISCTDSGAHAAAESGGPQTYVLTPEESFSHRETCTVTILADHVVDQDGDPQTMEADHVFTFTTEGPAVKISEIQGAGHISPYAGQQVSGVHGVVTQTRSNGFYMQDPNPDDDPATSEGIFVFTSTAPAVAVGDELRVGGSVVEFRPGGVASANLTLTEITGPVINVLSTGNELPPPVVIGEGGRMPPTETIHVGSPTGSVETGGDFDPETNGLDFYESLESMRVQVDDAVVVGPTNQFREIVVLPDDGAWASPRTARGGIIVTPDDFNPERIMLLGPVGGTPGLNVGDSIPGASVGVMDYSFGEFKIAIDDPITAVSGGLEREVTRESRDQELAVATFNVENLHPGSTHFGQLADLIVHNLRSPDLIGIEEVQDNDGPAGGTSSPVTDASVTWNMLVAAIEAAGGPSYEWRDIAPEAHQDGGQPGGNIRVGFLFRTDRGLEFVDRPGGDATTATQPVAHPSGVRLTLSPGRVDPQNEAWVSTRKPLAGEFRFRGKKLIAVVNHFSSKGGDDPLYGRFQPPVRHTEVARHQQAAVVNQFVRDILAVDPDALVVVNGDINDFDFSETVEILESGGALSTLMRTLPPTERYSYVFRGNSQVLDQTLASPSLLTRLVDYDVVHVNSEFHDQASDHEPQVARFWMIDSDRPRRR